MLLYWFVAMVLAVLVSGLGYTIVAHASAGDLDPTFGNGGKVTTDFTVTLDEAYAMALQADGKIVVAGITETNYGYTARDFALARYNVDGSLDTSFGSGGKLTTDFGERLDSARAVAVQPDGKIVAAGYGGPRDRFDFEFAIARYNSDGSLDTSFSGDGKLMTDIRGEGHDQIAAIALQPDGKIVAAGFAGTAGNVDEDFAVARYNQDGSLDTTFDGDGTVTTDLSGDEERVYDLTIQPDGKIVLVGKAGVGLTADIGLVRYNPNGSLDSTFSSDGILITDAGDDSYANAVVLQSDGKIVAAGGIGYDASDFALVRYNSDGSPDTSFGGDGIVTTDFVGSAAAVHDLALQSDGKIVAGGNSYSSGNDNFALARYDSDGTLDYSFSDDGILTTDFAGEDNLALGLALQGNGKIVLAGYTGDTHSPTYKDFALARYEGASEPGPEPTPGACTSRFSDVPSTNTFYPYVRCLACRGIISGYSDGTFRPNNEVTRGQLAKIVSNAAGFNEPVSGQTFQDVSTSSTFYEYIERLTARGYMTGYPCGSPGEPCGSTGKPYFRPSANATRAQTSKIVANSARYNEPPTEQTFEDVPSTHPFYAEIQRLASRGIMGGYQCGGIGEPCATGNRPYFRPYNNVTRGQSAKIIANTFYPDCYTSAGVSAKRERGR